MCAYFTTSNLFLLNQPGYHCEMSLLCFPYQHCFSPDWSASDPDPWDVPGKAREDGPRPWGPATHVDDLEGVQAPGFNLARPWLLQT